MQRHRVNKFLLKHTNCRFVKEKGEERGEGGEKMQRTERERRK